MSIVAYGADSASPAPSVPSLRAARLSFACRYLSYSPSKNITAAEVTRLRNGGIHIVSVWETTANRALDGYYAGQSDARAAVAQLKSVGAPASAPVFFAVDFDATGYGPKLLGYFQGAASVLGYGRTGVYGGLAAVSYLYAHGFRRLWQTYAWSGGSWHSGAALRQYSNGHDIGGVGVDLDYATAADYGQWDFTPPPPKPPVVKRILPAIVKAITKPAPAPAPHVAVLLGPWKDRPSVVRPGYEVLGPTGGTHLYYERKL